MGRQMAATGISVAQNLHSFRIGTQDPRSVRNEIYVLVCGDCAIHCSARKGGVCVMQWQEWWSSASGFFEQVTVKRRAALAAIFPAHVSL